MNLEKISRNYIIILVLWFLFLSIFTLYLWRKYPQYNISSGQLLGPNCANLKDFEIGENYLFSTSADPWISYTLPCPIPVKVITIKQTGLQSRDISANIYNADTWEAYKYQPHNGWNVVVLPSSSIQQNLRFDLVENPYQTIDINYITINSRFSLFLCSLVLSSQLLLFACFGLYFFRKKRTMNGTILFGIIVPLIVLICLLTYYWGNLNHSIVLVSAFIFAILIREKALQ